MGYTRLLDGAARGSTKKVNREANDAKAIMPQEWRVDEFKMVSTSHKGPWQSMNS